VNKVEVTLHIRGMSQAEVEEWISALVSLLDRNGAEVVSSVAQMLDEEPEAADVQTA